MSNAAGPVTPRGLKLRLYVMMFLQYFVQGCYLPIISVYLQDALGFDAKQVGAFGSALAVGPLAAPFIIGQLVDRQFATEKVLAFCHLCGGAIMLALYGIGVASGEGASIFLPVVILGTMYSTLYVPSMMLTNSLTFHHLLDRDREFPAIRLWGTIGFIVPAWLVEMVLLRGMEGDVLNEARGIVLAMSGVGGLVMGVYSYFLPHTPPASDDKKDVAPGKVLRLLRARSFLSLVLVSLVIAVVHKFYFVWNGPYLTGVLRQGGVAGAWEQRISSIGQVFEVVVMVFLGFSVKRFGFKWTMTLGALAYLLRCLIFAGAISIEAAYPLVMTLVCIGQALHGFCFGCFLAAAFMYVDRVSPVDARGSMQNFYGTFVLGVGFFAGGLVAGYVGDAFKTPASVEPLRHRLGVTSTAGLVDAPLNRKEGPMVFDWAGIWLSGAAIAGVALLGFLASFPKDDPEEPGPEESGHEESGGDAPG